MQVKELRCPYCKAPINQIGIDLGKVKCEYCEMTFIINKEKETHLEKFFRVWHEEGKRRAEWLNSKEYKKIQEKNKEEMEQMAKMLKIFGIMSIVSTVLLTIIFIITYLFALL